MQRNRAPIAEGATKAAKELWEDGKDQQVVVWIDNFYRRRHCTDPVQDDLSLSVSVMAVMKTVNLRPFPGYPPF